MWPAPIKLGELLERASSNDVPVGWLYLPKDWRTWREDTPAYVLDGEGMDLNDAEARMQGYASTIENQALEDVVRWASEVLKVDSVDGRLDVLIYYQRFDAFPSQLGAPDPPPSEETQLRLDREFFNSLGVERIEVLCRSPGCKRGAVALSVFCKAHHFEQIKNRTCPFSD